MGLLETIMGQVMGPASSPDECQDAEVLNEVGSVVNDPATGGLPGLIDAFQKQGLAGAVNSWVGTGANQSISAEQLETVLGKERVAMIASKLGCTPQDMAQQLAKLLPVVVDKLTPKGEVPNNDDVGQMLGSLLRSKPK